MTDVIPSAKVGISTHQFWVECKLVEDGRPSLTLQEDTPRNSQKESSKEQKNTCEAGNKKFMCKKKSSQKKDLKYKTMK